MTRKQALAHRAAKVGVRITTWSPGDGRTRYRFGNMNDPASADYDTCYGREYGWALGFKDAEAWLDAFSKGVMAAREDHWCPVPLDVDWTRGDL